MMGTAPTPWHYCGVNKFSSTILWKKGYRLNAKGEWHLPAAAVSNPVKEPDLCHGSERPDARKEDRPGSGCVLVITSYRVKLCDIDNLEPKFLIDALRYLKIIVDDDPAHVTELTLRQVRVPHYSDEHTEIIVCNRSDPEQVSTDPLG